MAEKEYIDTAQLFKCETCYHIGSDGKCNSYCDARESYRPAFSKLKIADVVEVVRCKDCKHYKQNPWNKETDMLCQCYSDWHATEPNDFCSYGERKDETT